MQLFLVIFVHTHTLLQHHLTSLVQVYANTLSSSRPLPRNFLGSERTILYNLSLHTVVHSLALVVYKASRLLLCSDSSTIRLGLSNIESIKGGSTHSIPDTEFPFAHTSPRLRYPTQSRIIKNQVPSMTLDINFDRQFCSRFTSIFVFRLSIHKPSRTVSSKLCLFAIFREQIRCSTFLSPQENQRHVPLSFGLRVVKISKQKVPSRERYGPLEIPRHGRGHV